MPDDNNNVTRYLFSDLILDIQRGTLYRDEEEIYIPKLSYDLLVALVASSPALLSQQMLMEKVWPDRVIGDETLKQRVKLLRKSLGDDATNPKYIEAVRGRGYRLRPEVKCECVINPVPTAIVNLSANDQFPNIGYQHLPGVWQKLSRFGLFMLLSISLLLFFTSVLYTPKTTYLVENTLAENSQTSLGKTKHDPVKTLTAQEKANQYYIKGKDYYLRYRKIDNTIAIDLFQKAIDKSPEMSLAYAGLSQAYSQQLFQFNGEESDKIKAIDYAYQAITFDNTSAEAYKALGIAYYVSGWLSKSIQAHLKALSLSPDNLETISNLGFIYSEQGKLAKALEWHKKALAINPEHIVTIVHTGQTLRQLGQNELAKTWFEKARDIQPDYLLASYHLGQVQLDTGQFIEAMHTYETALQLYQQDPLLTEGLADSYFYAGKTALAYQKYQEVLQNKNNIAPPRVQLMTLLSSPQPSSKDNPKKITELTNLLKNSLYDGSEKAVLSYQLALIYAYQQQEKQAIRYLVQAVEQGFSLVNTIEHQPLLQPFKENKTFKRILAGIKQKQRLENKSFSGITFFQSGVKNNTLAAQQGKL